MAFSGNFTMHDSHRRSKLCLAFIIIIKQSGHRCPPVVYISPLSMVIGQIPCSHIIDFRFFFSFIAKVHPSKIWRIHHFFIPFPISLIFFLLGQSGLQCHFIIEHFITILVKFCIVFPEIVIHALHIFCIVSQLLHDFCMLFCCFFQYQLQIFFFFYSHVPPYLLVIIYFDQGQSLSRCRRSGQLTVFFLHNLSHLCRLYLSISHIK